MQMAIIPYDICFNKPMTATKKQLSTKKLARMKVPILTKTKKHDTTNTKERGAFRFATKKGIPPRTQPLRFHQFSKMIASHHKFSSPLFKILFSPTFVILNAYFLPS
jgi:hypothetical protein